MLVIQCSGWIPLLLNVVLGYSACRWDLQADPTREYPVRRALVQSASADARIKGEVSSLCRCSLGPFGLTWHITCNCALGCFTSLQEGGSNGSEIAVFILMRFLSEPTNNSKSRARENTQETINVYRADGERNGGKKKKERAKSSNKDLGSKFTHSICKTSLPRSFASRLFNVVKTEII